MATRPSRGRWAILPPKLVEAERACDGRVVIVVYGNFFSH